MVQIAVMVSGSGTNLQALIDAVNNSEINGNIAVVISDKSNAYGLTRAKQSHIPALFISKNDTTQLKETLNHYHIDLIVLAGYLSIIPKDIVQQYAYRIINIHPSLIPSFSGKHYYGMAVHRAVYEAGVKYTGATTHFVDEQIDTGPIITQAVVAISNTDTPETIQQKVLEKEHVILVDTIKWFCNNQLVIEHNKVYVKESI